MNWAEKAKHYGAFIAIISPASGFYLFFVPHAHTLVLQAVSKSREREARFYCISYTNSECPAHVLNLFLMAPNLSSMQSFGVFPQPFPQTYADLQNAHFGIEDGQHLISIGNATPSRIARLHAMAITGFKDSGNVPDI
ncbi:hypothetical protein D5086_016558 [Populus alba]|uniref:Uncharacterized protein n=1 Tax=Populus alba TaxID=43335 RepID=A0ACC4BVJ1_POPAL